MKPQNNSLAQVSYKKSYSFKNVVLPRPSTSVEEQVNRSLRIISSTYTGTHHQDIVEQLESTFIKDSNLQGARQYFKLSPIVAEEMSRLTDEEIPLFLYHRYRYDVYPEKKILDKYPPCVQIEPSSICNLRCKFCYQTDKTFSDSKSSFMGTMDLDMFKSIVDTIETKVHFVTLASRGEPLLCKELPDMLKYAKNKFLSLKINTNALLLTEQILHSIFSNNVATLVLSIDSADKSVYEDLRVNGRFGVLSKKLNLLKKVKSLYPNSKTIVRVSGVYISPEQSLENMVDLWGSFVDQLVYVKYNPWENIYTSDLTGVNTPCSDLWRRLFIWQDGSVNCCDSDYKSTLLKDITLNSLSLSEIWHHTIYEKYRNLHLTDQRQTLEPCNRCSVV